MIDGQIYLMTTFQPKMIVKSVDPPVILFKIKEYIIFYTSNAMRATYLLRTVDEYIPNLEIFRIRNLTINKAL